MADVPQQIKQLQRCLALGSKKTRGSNQKILEVFLIIVESCFGYMTSQMIFAVFPKIYPGRMVAVVFYSAQHIAIDRFVRYMGRIYEVEGMGKKLAFGFKERPVIEKNIQP